LPCGNIDPLGITGTPVIDPTSRTLFLAAMTTPDGGATKQHRIFALSLASGWEDGEAVIRLHPGPAFSRQPRDYFATANWAALDARDADLGGVGQSSSAGRLRAPRPSWSPSGRMAWATLLDRANLGGMGSPLARQQVSREPITGAAAAYATRRGTYVVFSGRGIGCPEAIVWSVGAEGDNRLHGVDGDTGQPIFDGGGPGATMARIRRYQTPVAAKGRIFVAGDERVYAFRVPLL
jgi:hypothetical protein